MTQTELAVQVVWSGCWLNSTSMTSPRSWIVALPTRYSVCQTMALSIPWTMTLRLTISHGAVDVDDLAFVTHGPHR